jgi:hypothetical protein
MVHECKVCNRTFRNAGALGSHQSFRHAQYEIDAANSLAGGLHLPPSHFYPGRRAQAAARSPSPTPSSASGATKYYSVADQGAASAHRDTQPHADEFPAQDSDSLEKDEEEDAGSPILELGTNHGEEKEEEANNTDGSINTDEQEETPGHIYLYGGAVAEGADEDSLNDASTDICPSESGNIDNFSDESDWYDGLPDPPAGTDPIACELIAAASAVCADLDVPYKKSIASQDLFEAVTDEDLAMARFYKICDDAGAPKYLMDRIFTTLQEEILGGFNLKSPNITQRKSFFPRVQRKMKVEPAMNTKVTLHNGDCVHVSQFHFREQLQRHLESLPFASLDNIDMPDPSDPWSSNYPVGHIPTHTSLVDSTWYHNTSTSLSHLLADPEQRHYILHPLILYIDKTGTDGMMKTGLEPLMCTSANLKQQARQDTKNWFTIGYLPNLELTSSAGRKHSNQRANNIRDYHRCLSVLLEPLMRTQKEMPAMSIRRGDQLAMYHLVCPIATILGDNLSQNKLCGKSSNTTPSSVRMSRCCLTPYAETDTLPHLCHRVPSTLIERLSMSALGCTYANGVPEPVDPSALPIPLSPNLSDWQTAKPQIASTTRFTEAAVDSLRILREKVAAEILWKCLGSHSVANAFFGLDFGKGGCVHSATMTDIMHSLEAGIIKYVIEMLIEPLTNSEKTELDAMVSSLFVTTGRNRSGERGAFPRVSFTRGFCSLKKVTCDERVGQLFVISILLRTEDGKLFFEPRFADTFETKKRKRDDDEESSDCQPEPQPDSSEEDVEEDTNTNNQFSEAELWELMDKLDLGYVEIPYQHLPQHHQSILLQVMRKFLKKTVKLTKLLAQTNPIFVNGMLDYRPTVGDEQDGSSVWPQVALPFTSGDHPATSSLPELTKLLPRRSGCSVKMTLDQFAGWAEGMLSFHAALKYGGDLFKDPADNNIPKFQEAYCNLMTRMLQGLKRKDNSQQWRIQKFLECAHFGKDHVLNGPPVAHNTDTGERGLKTAKMLAHTAQKRSDNIFKGQVAKNSVESQILDLLGKALQHRAPLVSTEDTDGASTVGGSSTKTYLGNIKAAGRTICYRVVGRGDATVSGFYRTRPAPKKKGVDAVDLDGPHAASLIEDPVLQWFQRVFDQNRRPSAVEIKINLITQITLAWGTSGEEIVRAHPNYQQGGPWNDFVEVKYGGRVGSHPARVACFFEWPDNVKLGAKTAANVHKDCIAGDLMALIHSSDYKQTDDEEMDSLLYSHSKLEEEEYHHGDDKRIGRLTCVEARSFLGRIYVVDPRPSQKGGLFWKESESDPPQLDDIPRFNIIVIRDRKLNWPTAFLKGEIG